MSFVAFCTLPHWECSESTQMRASFAICSQFAEMLAKNVLSEHDIHEIMNELKVCYSLISAGWPQLEKSLAVIVRRSADAELAPQPIREVLDELEQSHDKEVWREKTERVYRSCFILVLSKRNSSFLLSSVKELLLEFPEFSGCHEIELALLLKFRNMMQCGIILYEAKSNKGKLMELAGRLSGKVCTTGGGSTADTKRRELIYERLGGVVKKKLAVPRKRKGQDDHSGVTDDLGPALPLSLKVKRPRGRARKAVAEVVGIEPGLESVDSVDTVDSCMYHPLPLERAISSITVDDPSELLLCGTASFPCSPLYSPSFPGTCFDDSYFMDKGLQTPMANTDCAVHAMPRLGEEPFGATVRIGANLPNHPYAPAAPMLQRGLTIDFSKPIFSDEFSFHLDLNMF